MKQKYLSKRLFLSLFLALTCYFGYTQSRGDIAFTAYNFDGDDDFAIVALSDISANSTIYFTDYEWDESGGQFTETGTDGFLQWDTGPFVIKAGTIVIFTDVDNSSNTNFGASIGTLTSLETTGFITSSGETVFAYTGSSNTSPTTFLTGIKNGTLSAGELDGTALGGTDLAAGTDFLEFDPTVSPDGGVFSSSRSDQASYSSYLSILTNEANWTRNTSDGEALLPFSQEAFTTSTTNWQGDESNEWSLAGNWDNGVPTSSSLVTIPEVTTAPLINSSTAAEVGNITITESDGITIDAGGSLIVYGTSSGNVTYNRTLTFVSGNDKGWHLVASPLSGQAFNNSYADTYSLATSGTKRGIGAYNSGDNTWTYLEDNDSNAGTLSAGVGYSMKRTVTGTVQFTGTINTDNVNGVSVSSSGDANLGFNLMGNPYTSYMSSQAFLDANTNLEAQIWTWTDASGYTARPRVDDFIIAPGQGFFVKANTGSDVDFAESNQSSGTDNFQRSSSSRTEIRLQLTDATTSRLAKLYYFDSGVTTGHDSGYEGKMFGGASNPFAIYTHLVADSEGKDYQIQSLPKNDMESMVIPIGINAASGKEISISAEALNLPNGINVYLEDKENNSFTQLDLAGAEYTTTLSSDLNGIGRFFLHTSSSALSVTSEELENISIYTSSINNLRIVGIQEGDVKLRGYNILGKQVVETSFQGKGVNDIELPNLRTGIYIFQLETSLGKLNKKVIID